MGWLTESSFIPKESKKINLESHSSLVNLKAKLLEAKSNLTKAPVVANPGVSERAAKDELSRPKTGAE